MVRVILLIATVCSVVGISLAQTPGSPVSLPPQPAVASPAAVGGPPPFPIAPQRVPLSAEPATNPVVNVWDAFPGAIEPPGTHHVRTNASGAPVHTFNLRPVVTNEAALTNDLSQVETREKALQQEMKQVNDQEGILKVSLIRDSRALVGIVTNFVPQDEEGKKLKARMEALVKELKDTQAAYQKKLEADPVYKAARAKVDNEQAELKALRERREKLLADIRSASAHAWQLKALKSDKQKENVQAPTGETKGGGE